MNTELGRPPTVEQLAEKLGRDVEDVLEAREALRAMRPASLDRPSAAGEDEDDIPLQRIGDIDPGYERTEEAVTIGRLVRDLPERERRILALRFGGDLTQSEIGEQPRDLTDARVAPPAAHHRRAPRVGTRRLALSHSVPAHGSRRP